MSVTKVDLYPNNNQISPFSLDEQAFYLLRERTYALADANKINDDIANGLMRYFATYYTFLLHENAEMDAEILRDDYTQAITKLEQIEDRSVLLKMTHTLNNWMTNIEEIYRKSGDFSRYLEWQKRMFKNMFYFINHPSMEQYYTRETKQEIADTFNTKKVA